MIEMRLLEILSAFAEEGTQAAAAEAAHLPAHPVQLHAKTGGGDRSAAV